MKEVENWQKEEKDECGPVKAKQFKQKLGSLNAKVLALQMKKKPEEVEKPAVRHAMWRRMQHPANSYVNEWKNVTMKATMQHGMKMI